MWVLCFSCIQWSISSLCVVIKKTLDLLRANWLRRTLEIIVFLTSKISNIKMVTLIQFLKFLRRALHVLWSQNNPCLSNHFRILKQRYLWSIQSREDKALSWYNIVQCQFSGNFDLKSSVPLCGAISLLKSLSFSCYVKRTKGSHKIYDSMALSVFYDQFLPCKTLTATTWGASFVDNKGRFEMSVSNTSNPTLFLNVAL